MNDIVINQKEYGINSGKRKEPSGSPGSPPKYDELIETRKVISRKGVKWRSLPVNLYDKRVVEDT